MLRRSLRRPCKTPRVAGEELPSSSSELEASDCAELLEAWLRRPLRAELLEVLELDLAPALPRSFDGALEGALESGAVDGALDAASSCVTCETKALTSATLG